MRIMASPVNRRTIAPDEMTLMARIIFHHLRQRLAHLGVAVDDEQLHYCGGAVKGAGKRVNNLVGSARLSWS